MSTKPPDTELIVKTRWGIAKWDLTCLTCLLTGKQIIALGEMARGEPGNDKSRLEVLEILGPDAVEIYRRYGEVRGYRNPGPVFKHINWEVVPKEPEKKKQDSDAADRKRQGTRTIRDTQKRLMDESRKKFLELPDKLRARARKSVDTRAAAHTRAELREMIAFRRQLAVNIGLCQVSDARALRIMKQIVFAPV